MMSISADKEKAVILHEWSPGSLPEASPVRELRKYLGTSLLKRMFAGETVAVADVNSYRGLRKYVDAHAERQTRSFLAVPFFVDGLMFALVIFDTLPRNWTQDDAQYLRENAERLFLRFGRAKAERALKDKEAELQSIADNTPLILVRCDRDLTYKFINRAGAALFGADPSAIVDRRIPEMMGQTAYRKIKPYLDRVLAGHRVEYETQIDYPVGRRDIRVSYIPERGSDGEVVGFLASIVDQTEQRKAERDQRFLLQISEMIRMAAGADELLADISNALGKHLDLDKCFFNEIDLERDEETIHRDFSRQGRSIAGKHRISIYSPDASREMVEGQTIVNFDSKVDPRTSKLYRKVYGPEHERSYITVPMFREGRWVAGLWCSDDKPRHWAPAEVSLVESIAERAWAAVERVRAQEQIRGISRMPEENPYPVIRVSAKGEVLYANPGAASVVASWEKRDGRVVLPESLLKQTRKAMRSGARKIAEVESDGYVFEFTIVPVLERKEANLYATDLTARKAAETALKQSEERFSKAFNRSPMVLTISSLTSGKLIEVNQTFVDATGFTREEAIGKTTLDLGLWMRPADRTDEMDTVHRAGQISNAEYVFRVRDGREIVGLLSAERIDILGEPCALTVIQDITDQKKAEQQRASLLESEAASRQQAETLNELSRKLAGELDHERLVQAVTDAATTLVRAQFGAFFYNLIDEEGESYQLYTLSGVPRSAFERFGMPRNTPIFDPTFRGKGVTRFDDVTARREFGTMSPHHGMPKGHLPVRSYLAAPVISRSGEVLGGLFFGHPEVAIFKEADERMIVGIAAIASVAMDNARLYGEAQREIRQRREAEAALRKSENELRIVTDSMPALISYIDKNERYVFANRTYSQWLGVDPHAIAGKSVKTVFGAKAYSKLKPNIAKALSGEEARFDAEVEYRGGIKRFIHAAYVPDRAADGSVQGYFGFTADMTDLRRSQELLRANEEKTSIFLENVVDYAVISTDVNGVIDTWNTGAVHIFGYTEDEAIGMDSARLFTPEDREKKEPEKERRIAKRVGRAADERWHIRKDGSRFYASGAMMPLYTGKALTGFAKIASDLTEKQRHAEELQRAHDELEMRVIERTKELADSNAALIREAEARIAGEQQRIYLLRRLVNSQEFERRRIARDIHDQLGQRLTGLRLKIASLRSIVGDSGEVADRVARLQEISERLDAEVSFLAWELRPTALDDLGLIEALRTFVHEWSRHHEIQASFHAVRVSDIRLDSDVETHLYRIAQEALNNTMKHSQAENVNVMLERRRNEVILIIEDDGVGFDPAKTKPASRGTAGGLGLTGMRERASLIGGNLEIESSAAGTTIYVRVATFSGA